MVEDMIAPGGSLTLADGLTLSRMGFGAMQLAGPGVWGPPRDRAAAVAVLRAAVDAGVTHIDTSDFYGPVTVNEVIREALHPYPDGLHLVTKIGFRRGDDRSWLPASSPDELTAAVHDNLDHLGLDALDVVNLRIGDDDRTSIADRFGVLAALREKGLVRHLGLSNVSAAQLREAQAIAPVVCVQNLYNVVERERRRAGRRVRARGRRLHPVLPAGRVLPAAVGGARRRRRAGRRDTAAGGAGLAAAAVADHAAHPRHVVGRPPAGEPRRGGRRAAARRRGDAGPDRRPLTGPTSSTRR